MLKASLAKAAAKLERRLEASLVQLHLLGQRLDGRSAAAIASHTLTDSLMADHWGLIAAFDVWKKAVHAREARARQDGGFAMDEKWILENYVRLRMRLRRLNAGIQVAMQLNSYPARIAS
jgi:hypothetical protein